MKRKTRSQYHQRRYYLHRVLKNHVRVIVKNREVDIAPYQSISEVPAPYRWYVGELIRLGYIIQLNLF